MFRTATVHSHLDARGVAWIDDTSIKVSEAVLDNLAYGWRPEEIHFQHPDLSMPQIHAPYMDARVPRAITNGLRLCGADVSISAGALITAP
jgi:hypothetical protein